MKIAVFSDIHGNCVALNTVLSDMKQRDVVDMVSLGDAIQGGAQPAETVSRLRELRVPTAMGNADSWLLTGEGPSAKEPVSEAQREVRAWSLSRLSEEDLDFLRQFKSTITVALGEVSLLCFHGAPASFDDQILPTTSEEEVVRMVGGFGDSALCEGHTHLQQIRRVKESFYFNPGSVGFSYDHSQTGEGVHADPWAEYAIVSSEKSFLGLEFRRVPFDVEELIRMTVRSGRPCADRVFRQYSGQN